MKVGFVSELASGEPRIALTPETVQRYRQGGAEVVIERGFGWHLGMEDAAFESAGAVCAGRGDVLGSSQLLVRVGPPPPEEVEQMGRGTVHVSFLDPFGAPDLVDRLRDQGVSALSMEMIPRTTYAQKMDALSSQSNLAGYVAVILAAGRTNRILPMMTTPSGTIRPLQVFVIGAGVAGLQAIATARRLGARVSAFDTRPVACEQVKSLGARFVEIDLGEAGETGEGYAKELTPEQVDRQRQAMASVCAQSNIVITTAQVFGRKAPVIVTEDMIGRMMPGTVVVDLAVETGGNVEGSRLDQEVVAKGVIILGYARLAGRVPVTASSMYANNVYGLFTEVWDPEKGVVDLARKNDIVAACLLTHEGRIVNERLLGARNRRGADVPGVVPGPREGQEQT